MRHQKIFQKLKLPDFNINKQQNLDLPLQFHTTNNAYQLWLHHEYEEWEQQNLWLALPFPTEKIQLCIRMKASQCTGMKRGWSTYWSCIFISICEVFKKDSVNYTMTNDRSMEKSNTK